MLSIFTRHYRYTPLRESTNHSFHPAFGMCHPTMNKLTTIDDGQISGLLQADGLSVVLMTSPWDGNGIILQSIIENLTSQFPAVQFRVADYETSPRLARLFNLMSPPGVLLIKAGEMIQRVTGPVSAGRISDLIREAA